MAVNDIAMSLGLPPPFPILAILTNQLQIYVDSDDSDDYYYEDEEEGIYDYSSQWFYFVNILFCSVSN